MILVAIGIILMNPAFTIMAAGESVNVLASNIGSEEETKASTTTPSGIPFAEIGESVDRFVAPLIDVSSPGLAVVVFSEDEIIFSQGYGHADIELGIPIRPDETVFEYGSVSKLFVYTTLMQLYEDGKLDLQTDVRELLPDKFLKKLRYDEPVALIDIMNHQAGFEDVLLDVVVTHPIDKADFHDVLRTKQPEQVYRPGTIFAYSNYAVSLAAYIAELKLEQDFHAYLKSEIFTPSGMTKTTAHPDMADMPDLADKKARAYSMQGDGLFHDIGWSYIPLYPIGAVNGTAEDLARFGMALMPPEGSAGVLFSQRDTIDEMLEPTAQMGPDMTGFAHGFIERDSKIRSLGHGGNTAGFTAQINITPEQRFGVVVLANAANEMELTSGLTSLLLGPESGEAGYSKLSPDANETIDADSPAGDSANQHTSKFDGFYISARRPHNGFLKIYSYLSPLHVESIDSNRIKLQLGEQTAEYKQISPGLFEKTTANGVIFNYHFNRIYFETAENSVVRMTGDFTPPPAAFSPSWLVVDIILLAISILLFLSLPLDQLFRKITRYIGKSRRQSSDDLSASNNHITSQSQKHAALYLSRPALLLSLGSLAIIANNIILAARMLTDNYRSHSEVLPQLLLNYPLAIVGPLTALITYRHLNKKKNEDTSAPNYTGKSRPSLCARIQLISAIIMTAALYYLLIKWGFIGSL